jgi:hypothetical protein
MKTQMRGLAVAATALTALAGCAGGSPTQDRTAVAASADGGLGSGASSEAAPAATPKSSKSTHTTASAPAPAKTTTKSVATGPQIVYFKVAQKPKCAEGTAVFRAEAVPLIIKWKIRNADSGALSVDDHTHTAGTYGPVDLVGSEEFTFSCGGAVGSVETHTYAIYSVGGGTQRSKTLTISAKVLDQGKNAPS